MIHLKKVNHKLISVFIGVAFSAFSILNVNDYLNIQKEIKENSEQIENYKNQSNALMTKISSLSGKLAQDTDLSYYAGNIYAYALLEEFYVEIKNGETKYKNTISMNLTFDEFKDKEKFKNFLKSLSYLGYVENISKKNLTLHVTSFTVNDAKKLIISNHKE